MVIGVCLWRAGVALANVRINWEASLGDPDLPFEG